MVRNAYDEQSMKVRDLGAKAYNLAIDAKEKRRYAVEAENAANEATKAHAAALKEFEDENAKFEGLVRGEF